MLKLKKFQMKIWKKGIIKLKILKRIWNFDEQDIKHIVWLFKQLIISFFKGDINGVEECWIFIKIHCCYDNTKIN